MLKELLSGGERYTDYREFECAYFHAIKHIMEEPSIEIACESVEQKQRLGYMMQVALWLMPDGKNRIFLTNRMNDILKEVEPYMMPSNIWTKMQDKPVDKGCASAFRWKIMSPISHSRLRQFIDHQNP